jgi:hypothetical protein
MNSPSTSVLSAQEIPSARQNWEVVGNVVVLFAYSCVVLFTVHYHEKWADEAQAWLIARDSNLKTIWFYHSRYEGSPALWHTILWLLQRLFHASYDAMSYIGSLFAIGGVSLFIFKAPFPCFVRWPMVFTYFLIYQYAVIARPYTLMPLLCFLVALTFKDIKHPGRMTWSLVFLANLTLHGAIMAACFGLLYLVEAIKQWPRLDQKLRYRYVICIAVVASMFVFVAFVLKPPADSGEFIVKRQMDLLPEVVKQQIHMPTVSTKLAAALCGAFLDSLYPSVLFLMFAGIWCFRRRFFLVLVLPVGLLLALYSIVHGYAHHHGTVLLAVISALWISWPTDQERFALCLTDKLLMRGLLASLIILCGVNIWDSIVVIQREYRFPYSGAQDAANYLKSVGADRTQIFGVNYGVVGVQPYFDHNIFANIPNAYFHHGLPLAGSGLDEPMLELSKPEYVVVYSTEPALLFKEGLSPLTSRGYEIVHFSDGYYLYKQAVYERESYFIFRRTRP